MASSSAEAGPRGAWPRLRALLVTLALLLHASLAAPWPDLDRRDLGYEVAQDELRRWSGRLAGLGLQASPAELQALALRLGRASDAAQDALHGPFRPFLRVTGTGQAWGLFAYPDPYAGRLVVSGRTGAGPWATLYRAPGEGEAWLVALLQNRKVRGVYDDKGDRPKPGAVYERFCTWLAGRVFARHPAVDGVEIRLDLVTIRVPGDPRPPVPDRRRHVRLRHRGAEGGVEPGPLGESQALPPDPVPPAPEGGGP